MCKGTTNGEDVYIIPKSKIPKETLEHLNKGWISNHGGIPVDKCIGEEVESLIVRGIVTVGSCCGHGEYGSHALALMEDTELATSLGYKTELFLSGLIAIYLKSGTQSAKSFYSWCIIRRYYGTVEQKNEGSELLKKVDYWSFGMDYEKEEIVINALVEEEKIQLRICEKDINSMKSWFDLARHMKNHKWTLCRNYDALETKYNMMGAV